MNRFARAPLAAVLGPTNTGKTHLAVERMLGHSSGMIGFPLRLLAREVYDRVVAARGPGAAALVTGEERIWPESARYILCTAESMPFDGRGSGSGRDPATPADVAFLALDEAQLGQDRERGHVFTSRLLHARGREETMILGAGTLGPVVRDLLPDADIIGRPRFSTLRYDGPRKLSRLPPRSVVVAFSAEEVYAIAEALRRFSGGAGVVMGALSPRTRNAQVAMFQAGEVDYLVATDAIGMGLNLDVAHVAFASLNKFDGVRNRRLTLPEMAQIAGRAGRHQRDGSFGSVGAEAAFTDEEVAAIEEHRFPPLDWLYWRNPAPDMGSAAALIASLEAPPPHERLRPAPEATDLAILRRMAGDEAAMALVDGEESVRRLWSLCQLPDFTKAGVEGHGRFVARLWSSLAEAGGRLPDAWFDGQLQRLDHGEGTVEALGDRIARVRTCCYIAQRADWLSDPADASARAQAVETRLSDALHAALTARFVDRRTTVLLRSLGQGAANLPVTIDADAQVRVDGEAIGTLDGFAFIVDPTARGEDRRMLLAAAERHLAVTLAQRASELAAAPAADLSLVIDAEGGVAIHWRGGAVATLARGKSLLVPRIVPVKAIAVLDAHIVAAVIARLDRFVDEGGEQALRPMLAISARARDAATPPAMRAVLAALADACGAIARGDVDRSLTAMEPADRHALANEGIRVGSLDVFHPHLLKPGAQYWLAALDAAWRGRPAAPQPTPGIVLLDAREGFVPGSAYRRIGEHWLRVDLVERIARYAHRQRQSGSDGQLDRFLIDPELARSIGLPLDERIALYAQLGFLPAPDQPAIDIANEAGIEWRWRGRRRETARVTDRPAGQAAARPRKPKRTAVRQAAQLSARVVAGGAEASAAPARKAAPSRPRESTRGEDGPFAALAVLLRRDGNE